MYRLSFRASTQVDLLILRFVISDNTYNIVYGADTNSALKQNIRIITELVAASFHPDHFGKSNKFSKFPKYLC